MNDRLSMLDILNILSFFIGVMNLNENLTQGDKQDLMSALNKSTADILNQINKHLEIQDIKIDSIMDRLEDLKK